MRRFLALLLVIPLVSAQLLEDPAGDVEVSSYGNNAPAAGNWQAVDLRGLTIEELPDDLLFTVDIEGMPDCAQESCPNTGDLRTYFQYGDLAYYVQQGINGFGNAYGQLHITEPGGVDGPPIATGLGATIDLEATAVTVTVPRDLIVDEAGTPPIKNRSLTDILVRSYSQWSFGGPDVTGSGESDMLVTRDRMGFEAPASFTFQTGGSESHGALVADSETPFRASNGGAATYRYDIRAKYMAEGSTTLDMHIEGLPTGWSFARPNGTLTVDAGQEVTFPILIETPSGHQHGGTDVFHLVIEDTADEDNWARVELGVHYLKVPQPAGHHPTLFLHTLTDGPLASAGAAFGNDNGRVWMNTLEDDPGDEGVPVVGQEGFEGFTEQTTRWSVCMIPNLRLGLDMDIMRTGEMEVSIGATAPHNEVSVTGRLLHIAGPEPLDFCDPRLYEDRNQTEIATLDSEDTKDILGDVATFSLTATPTSAGDYIPYEEGAQLVLELEATFTGGDPGPEGLSLHDGWLTLPLIEYRDTAPTGLSAPVAGNETDLGSFEEAEAPTEKSPAGWLLLPLVIAVVRRRRA